MCLALLDIESEYTLQACSGLPSLLSVRTDFITAWRNVMTRRGPRGAENWGEEKQKTTGSSRGGGERLEQGRRNTTADSGFFPLSRSPLSVKC